MDGRRCSAQRGSGGQNFSTVSMNHLFDSAADDAARRSPFVGPAMVLSVARAACCVSAHRPCVLMRRGAEAGLVGAGAAAPPPHPTYSTSPSPLLSSSLPHCRCSGLFVTEPVVLCQKKTKKKKAFDCQPQTDRRRPRERAQVWDIRSATPPSFIHVL